MSDVKDVIIGGVTYPVKDKDARDRLGIIEEWKSAIASWKTDLDSWKDALFSTIYPVGSIYITTDKDFDPGDAFGGTWSRIAKGKALVGVNETSSIDNMKDYIPAGFGYADTTLPTHSHTGYSGYYTGTVNTTTTGSHAHSGTYSLRADDDKKETVGGALHYAYSGYNRTGPITVNANGNHYHSVTIPNHRHTISTEGVAATNKNYQPSVAVYIWRCDSRS